MSEIIIRIPVQALRALLQEALDHIDRGEDPPPDRAPSGPGGERPWTDAQRRMVYRLVHQLGYEGDAARNFIATTLRLKPGETPGMREASRLIDSLKEQVADHGNGARREAS